LGKIVNIGDLIYERRKGVKSLILEIRKSRTEKGNRPLFLLRG
jgi:hypothetical protein